jgi:hypothetical protein
LFDAIALTFLVLAWLALGAVPWIVLSVRMRGEAGFPLLAACCALGVVGGLLVPLAGLRGWTGVLVSLAAALSLAGLALLALIRVGTARNGSRASTERSEGHSE